VPTKPRKTVLVAGASGRLGGVADLLLADGHRVRAMTRDPGSSRAAELRELGAEIVFGDFDDPASIEAAAEGADAVFATGTAHRAGPEGEFRHGRNVADAAAAAGAHLVYGSGDGAAADSPLPLFRAKFEIEEHIRTRGGPHTILAPVYFMENLFNPWNLPALRASRFPSPLPVELVLQQAAIADVASFAVLAIERTDEFAGRRLTIASDELSGERAAAILSAVLDRDLEAEQIPVDQLPPGVQALFGWLERTGHSADIAALRWEHPEIGWHRYQDWAHSQRARFRELCPHPSLAAH